jgi:hypothetical protein
VVIGWWREPRLSKSAGASAWSVGIASVDEDSAAQHVMPTAKSITNIDPPLKPA